MAQRLRTPLPVLTPEELEHVRGSGGNLDIAITAPPLRGQVTLGATGPHATLSGTLSLDGRTWAGGLQTTLRPAPNVTLGGFARTDGQAWEAGVEARIRFLRA